MIAARALKSAGAVRGEGDLRLAWGLCLSLGSTLLNPQMSNLSVRKEVIQPQVPLRLPCYDFTPVADYTVVKGIKPCLKVEPTPMV